MRTLIAAGISAALTAAALFAQTTESDFSGRWRLVEPTAAELSQDTLAINAADELAITQTPLNVIIAHPSKTGTHPEAGIFNYGAGGTTAGEPRGALITGETRWGASYIGTDLMISYSMTAPPDERGVRITFTRGSMWRLEGRDRLVIEFGQSRTGERPKLATRVYSRIPPR
jgi:hypothetical protein